MSTVISSAYTSNTLEYDSELCNGCGMCSVVCPHRVFEQNGRVARLVRPRSCMECGACKRNCPTGAIAVEAGVGCAAALILAAIRGRGEPACGCGDATSCCGSA
jgi:NAD-dependent dihydropyrimidine dehydrogenase PreA subunit